MALLRPPRRLSSWRSQVQIPRPHAPLVRVTFLGPTPKTTGTTWSGHPWLWHHPGPTRRSAGETGIWHRRTGLAGQGRLHTGSWGLDRAGSRERVQAQTMYCGKESLLCFEDKHDIKGHTHLHPHLVGKEPAAWGPRSVSGDTGPAPTQIPGSTAQPHGTRPTVAPQQVSRRPQEGPRGEMASPSTFLPGICRLFSIRRQASQTTCSWA